MEFVEWLHGEYILMEGEYELKTFVQCCELLEIVVTGGKVMG